MADTAWCWNHFYRSTEHYQEDKTHHKSRCKACVARRVLELKDSDERDVQRGMMDYIRSPEDLHNQGVLDPIPVLEDVPPICGKAERMLSHLRKCPDVVPDVRAFIQACAKNKGSTVRLSRNQQIARAAVNAPAQLDIKLTPVHSSQRLESIQSLHLVPQGETRVDSLQEEFAQDLCQVFISCNVAWNSAANPQLLLFFSKYVPEAKIPDRRVLSGRVLDSLVCQVETEMKAKVSGKFGTGQCDGRKSNAKASIITTLVTVEGKLYMIAAHDISMDKKTSDHLLELVLADMKYCEDELGITYIAWCTDDGGGNTRGMRRQLKEVRPKLLTPPCWGHQVHIIFILTLPSTRSFYAYQVNLVVKWFTNHSRALGLLKAQQKETDCFTETHRILTLIFLVISRWIFHFLTCRRLLTLAPPMRTLYLQQEETLIECAGSKWDAKERARRILAPVENPQFWKNLAEVKILLEPLAIAAKCMQAPDAGLDQVLLMLGNLNCIYRVSKSGGVPWNEPDLDFHAAFFDYSRDSNEFSSAYMQLAEMKPLCERENKHVDVVRVWETLDTGESNRCNGLVRLAIWLLSIVANSAGSERGSSKFGIFLTKLRNLLSIQKVRKMNTVDMDLKRKHEELGMVIDCVKPKFAHFSEEFIGEKNPNFGYDETESFGQLATQLIQDFAGNQNIPVDDDEEHSPTRSPHSLVNYQLKNLFQFPENGSESLVNGLGFYWQGGIKDLQEELEVYDLLMEDFDL
ncbi:ribonuclease H-like domain-containing protein [Mycena crocata]|nr:ribonuclease H-like domain-containing protein [Mycena crocata]